jgi:hypothetical protein
MVMLRAVELRGECAAGFVILEGALWGKRGGRVRTGKKYRPSQIEKACGGG